MYGSSLLPTHTRPGSLRAVTGIMNRPLSTNQMNLIACHHTNMVSEELYTYVLAEEMYLVRLNYCHTQVLNVLCMFDEWYRLVLRTACQCAGGGSVHDAVYMDNPYNYCRST